jgi:acetylglutamate kinase
VGALAKQLGTRKLVVLRRRGGLGPHERRRLELAEGHFLEAHAGGISVINLRADLAALLAKGELHEPDVALLGGIERMLNAADSTRTTLSVTVPMALLNELFTVRGAGTLVKLGSRIRHATSYEVSDVDRIRALLEASFSKALDPTFFDTQPLAIYFEENYRGTAIVHQSPLGPFLSKFAVEPVARGEGIGQDLWRAMLKDSPKLFWRARAGNPIFDWYVTVCDGFSHTGAWTVFWRGAQAERIPDLIQHAVSQPHDFPE